MNYKYNKKNDIVRAALFYEYEGKCFYSNEPLRYKEMHIDHIIPQGLTNEKFKEIISTLGLPEDFNINSLYNLVPCNPNVNEVKNKNTYPKAFLGHCIYDKTTKKVDKVKNRIEQLKKDKNIDKAIAKLVATAEGSIGKEELERIYDSISNEKPYEKSRRIHKYSDSYSYCKSLSNVELTAHLPLYPNIQGSCLITFNTLRLRDCMITLNHEQILNRLFEGIKTDLESGMRKFIIQNFYNDKKDYFVDLANVRIPLERDEVIQLLDIIDDFYDIYIESVKEIYQVFDWSNFHRIDRNKNNLTLCKISKKLWFEIGEFCRKFDYQNGNTEWHIFDATGSMIKILDRETDDFRAFIYPMIEECKYEIYPIDNVSIIWTDEYFWDKKLQHFKENEYWKPILTYKWLVENLIPKVVYEMEIKKTKKLFSPCKSFESFKKEFIHGNYINSIPIKENEMNLLTTLEKLQSFFNGFPSIELQTDDLSKLYKVLKKIIINTDRSNLDINFIKSNLRLELEEDNKENLLKVISSILDKVDNETSSVSLYKVDLILRCMIATIKDCNNCLVEEDTKYIKNSLNKYYNLMIREEIRSKG
ncbi:HNH endonuclease [Lysinibacillus fusiformis]|uniref:HNH endonuclease n=1 Tax=Lysinibacillus fusiformis TaxID=28031 RepID=UPI003557C8BF